MMTPISFEFFPPKTDEQKATLEASLPKLKLLKPDYVSCTFGAGGSTLNYTPETIRRLREAHGLDARGEAGFAGVAGGGADVGAAGDERVDGGRAGRAGGGEDEDGASLYAAGWDPIGRSPGGHGGSSKRPRDAGPEEGRKVVWVKVLRGDRRER